MNPYRPPNEGPDDRSQSDQRVPWRESRAFRWFQRLFLAYIFTVFFYPAGISDPVYRSLCLVAIFIGFLIAFMFFYRSSSE